MNTKQQAFNLYFQSDLTQQQIADLLNINRKTLYTWMRAGDWKRARHTARHAPTLLVQQYYDQLTAMNAHIAMRADQPFPTKDEADVMRKLSMVIKHVRTTWTPSDMMDIFTLFQSNLVRSGQIDKATELMPLLDDFVQKSSEGSRSYEPLTDYYNGLSEDEEYDRWLAEQNTPNQAVSHTGSNDVEHRESDIPDIDANSQMNCHTEPEFTPMHPCQSGTSVASDASHSDAEIETQNQLANLTQTDACTTPPSTSVEVNPNLHRCVGAEPGLPMLPHRVEMGHDESNTQSHNILKNNKEYICKPSESPEKK